MKHLLKINADSEAVFKDHDVVYYAQNSGKSYVKKHYDNPFIKIFMSNSYHDTSIIPLIAKKYGDISGEITWSHNLGNKATIEDGVIRFLQHYTGTITVTATAGGKSDSHTATIDCEEIPTSYTYSILNVSKPTATWDNTSAEISFTYRVVENYPLKPSTTTDTPHTVTVNFPKYEHVFDYTTGDGYVDLGLPSHLKWAACSIGAKKEYEHGLFFQWGDTEGYLNASADETIKRSGTFDYESVEDTPWEVNQTGFRKYFNWENYKYCEGNGTTMTKYCNSTSYGTVDDKLELDAIDDAVIQHIGGIGKRMPKTEEFQELKNNTLWIWRPSGTVNVKKSDTEIEEVTYPAGYFVYKAKAESDKGKVYYSTAETLPDNYTPNASIVDGSVQEGDTHIFFPASGYCDGGSLVSRGSRGYYWSSSLNTSNASYGRDLYFYGADVHPQGGNHRYYGFCVRAVSEN